MNLKSWVELERGRAVSLAKSINVPPSFISRLVDGSKGVPIERCVPIERATAGAVTRQDLRPDDWQDIWPELAKAPASPSHSAIELVALETRHSQVATLVCALADRRLVKGV